MPTWAEMATRGVELVVASATPSSRLIAPGPSVAEQTPARPVSRPYVSAMNDAACSCRTSTYRIDDRDSASTRWMFSSPGMPKTYSTPSFSRLRTIRSAVVSTSADPTSAGGGGLARRSHRSGRARWRRHDSL